MSKGSRREDREVEPRLYADAGVPEYWRVEQGEQGEAIVYQYRLARLAEEGAATYAAARVTTLVALESS